MDEETKIVLKAIDYMKNHLEQDLTTKQLANHVSYSTYHFIRIFKDVTSISPRRYLSALRIEHGKEMLANSSSPTILNALLGAGFWSVGTFSTVFKNSVGLSPKGFQNSIKHLHSFLNSYRFQDEKIESIAKPAVFCHLEIPKNFRDVVFVGLFTKPIPYRRPVVGTAVKSTTKKCLFTMVPPGEYYLLNAAIPWSLKPKDYFLPDNALMGKAEHPILIEDNTITEATVLLRNPLPYDPPIIINLPRLLFEKDSNLEKIQKHQSIYTEKNCL